ncbi:factor-independent urate hydroxylase [Rhizohabitans arisaemae]|uniref:factor-independent urate hydroxylase n=1 Tax=Rhizohabitans arisaemae TaxID=2720610 RepID=UPI0024B27A74|nr:urate oxidase [Rhizohabitans arisaemae]
MSIVLGPNRYGKAETRVVRVDRDGARHRIKDCNVGVSLSGDLHRTHLSGDNRDVLPTDTQKNTVYAFAAKYGIASAEEFALLLARHFTGATPAIRHARVVVEEYAWDRIPGASGHSFARSGGEVRDATVHCDRDGAAHVVSGIGGLVVMNTTDSEFHGFAGDEYTTLAPTRDRILATEVRARWRHTAVPDRAGWDDSYRKVRSGLLDAFAQTYSFSLQQTLYAMGSRVLADNPEICEVRLTLPNRHHFAVDLSPFRLDNDNRVFHAADRPYGLIEGSVLRDDAPDAGPAWE